MKSSKLAKDIKLGDEFFNSDFRCYEICKHLKTKPNGDIEIGGAVDYAVYKNDHLFSVRDRVVFEPKLDLILNNIDDTDSYKLSHFLLYGEELEYMESYLEARGGEYDKCTLFGLQYIVHRYLAKRITLADINAMEADAELHGEPFNRDGWLHVLSHYNGHVPITVRAIPEGTKVPIKNVVAVVRSPRDKKIAWITNWMETQLSRVWYPSTVAIASHEISLVWRHFLELSSDNPDAEIMFKHHDFGSRGVTCREQAQLGGAAHLLSFLGSDTIAGVKTLNHYYDIRMSGFSIPATEHSTMTIGGRKNERKRLIKWIQKTLVERQVPTGMPKLSACVADSYNIYNFVKMCCEDEIRLLVKDSGGTLVIRPDSGKPIPTLLKLFEIFEQNLPQGEITVNTKGYKALPNYFRLIWGDGINRRSMKEILQAVVDAGWSVSNLAFGSGGGLLMDFDRDTQKWAFKCCYAIDEGQACDVSKDPIDDPTKKSKEGRLDLVVVNGQYTTVILEDGVDEHPSSVLVTYYNYVGEITFHNTAEQVRARLAA